MADDAHGSGAPPAVSIRSVLSSFSAAALIVLAATGCAAVHLARAAVRDRPEIVEHSSGSVDDASHLNRTAVREVVDVAADDATAITQIRTALQRARAASVSVSIAGFRHSMGGQTIAPNGIVLNMLPHNRMALIDATTLRVQSGAVWKDVVEYLDKHGRSVAVMQSDSPFSIGGSLSVNCHGWQHLHEPIASTVLAMTVVDANGDIVHCSRSENATLFSHILGGYGLFGVILDADLETVPNERYVERHTACDVASYETVFSNAVRDHASVGMAFARVSVAPDTFLREAVLTTYEREPGPLPTLGAIQSSKMERLVFRGSVGSAYGKNLRWRLENLIPRLSHSKHVSRNQVLHQTIEDYVARDANTTDILHEYFIPRGKLAAFMKEMLPVLLRRANVDLLNITIRDVKKDNTSALAYAREDVFAVVMFFSQKRTADGEEAMQRVTRELIDVATSFGGTYYLPYRLHATVEQFDRAYPEGRTFFDEKRRLDPRETFSSQWYERYGKPQK